MLRRFLISCVSKHAASWVPEQFTHQLGGLVLQVTASHRQQNTQGNQERARSPDTVHVS